MVDGEEEDEERRMRGLDRAIQDATIETWCEAARGEVICYAPLGGEVSI